MVIEEPKERDGEIRWDMAQTEMASGNVVRRPYETTSGVGPIDADVVAVERVDRVRWGAILAGLFTAISILLTLTVLGLALGLASWNPDTPATALGVGAGVWGLVTSIIAFGVGGFVAGRTGALPGREQGLINGGMVWAVAIPLLLWLLGSGVGTLLNVAANVADAGVAAVIQDPAAVATAVGPIAGATPGAGAAATPSVAPLDAEQADQVADDASRTAWGTLLWMGLGFGAAALAGAAGARVSPVEAVRRDFRDRRNP